MSAAQTLASQQFLDAMGSMVNEEHQVSRVMKFISMMKQDICPIVSDEEYAKLIPAETMFKDLKGMVHNYYKA